ncbi:MAG: hypothetical protein ACKOHK_04295, partial [Planctomycetia bacterium]
MSKKRESGKRPADRRPTMGGSNLLWSLIAAGVAGLFAMSLIGATPEIELSYSDLEKLIRASGEGAGRKGPAKPAGADRGGDEEIQRVGVNQPGTDGRQTVRYGDLRDVVIGAFQVSGTVRDRDGGGPAAKRPGTEATGTLRRFHTATLPSEHSESQLMRPLSLHGIPFRYE